MNIVEKIHICIPLLAGNKAIRKKKKRVKKLTPEKIYSSLYLEMKNSFRFRLKD